MSEERRVIKRFESFVLGYCRCGCNKELDSIWRRDGYLKKCINTHTIKKQTEENNGYWKGGRTIDVHGYILVRSKGHPKAKKNRKYYILEHRLVMEKHLGRYLEDWEEIHHINQNVQDNRIENLMVLTKAEHKSLHQRMKRESKELDS